MINQVSRQETQEQWPWQIGSSTGSNGRTRGASDGQGWKETTFDGNKVVLET